MEAHLPPFNVEIVLGDDHQQEVLGEIKLQTDADKTMVAH